MMGMKGKNLRMYGPNGCREIQLKLRMPMQFFTWTNTVVGIYTRRKGHRRCAFVSIRWIQQVGIHT